MLRRNSPVLGVFLTVALLQSGSAGLEFPEGFDLQFKQAKFSATSNDVAFRGPIVLTLPNWSIAASTGSVLRFEAKIVKKDESQYGVAHDFGELILFGTVSLTGPFLRTDTQPEVTLTTSCLILDLKENRAVTTGPAKVGEQNYAQAISLNLENGEVALLEKNKSLNRQKPVPTITA